MFDVAPLIESAGKAASIDASMEGDESLFEVALGLERARALLDVAESKVLAELEARDACDREHGLATSRWLAREARLASGTARRRVAVANGLRRHFPATLDAMAEGDVSFDHAAVLVDATNARIAAEMGELEAELLEMATDWVFEPWRQHVRLVAALLDQDGGYDPHADVHANRLRLRHTPDGTLLDGTLVGDAALVSDTVLDEVANELLRRYRADNELTGEIEVPSRATLLALAFAEICRRAQAVEVDSHRPPRTEAVVLIDADDLDRAHFGDGARVGGSGGPMRLMCDASLFAIVVDSLGVPLDMGREVRTATAAQRRALVRRDGGCTFPGCGCPPSWCDAHHVDHWVRDVGETNVTRMALLCRHHHGVAHRRGWHVTIDEAGWITVVTPRGRRLDGQRHHRLRAGP
ncbi:MAG: DUF222 domain-containing protein [Acidimicrobiales bacterium]